MVGAIKANGVADEVTWWEEARLHAKQTFDIPTISAGTTSISAALVGDVVVRVNDVVLVSGSDRAFVSAIAGGVATLVVLGEEFTQYKWFFWIATFIALIALFITSNILQSRYGRTWRAIRSNSLAAELSGVHSGRMKILAFTISSALAGLAGAVMAMTISLVAPGAYTLSLSFALVTGAVLAGVSSLPGVVFGALILVAIPEVADVLANRLGGDENLNNYLPGLMMIMMMKVIIMMMMIVKMMMGSLYFGAMMMMMKMKMTTKIIPTRTTRHNNNSKQNHHHQHQQ